MALYKRGNIWWAYVMIDGVRHCRTTGMSNRRLAEAFERRFEEELAVKAAGFTELKPEMTFTELAARFLSSGEVKAHHAGRLKMLLPFWGHRELRSINRAMVREYRAARTKGKSLTETTLNRDLEVLRHLLFWAVDEGILAANPLARLRMARARKRKRPILSWEDEQRLTVAAAPHLRRIIVAALDTGMRRGELTHQQWQDVDLTRGILSVTHSKTAEGEQRELPLTDRLRSMLAASRQTEGLVFTFKGEAVAQIKTGWAGAIRRSGIQRLRFHDLRHCFNTRLLELGVLTDVRKALMGHSSGEDVHSMYTHVELPLKRKAIGLLNGWISEQLEGSQPNEKEAIDAGSDPGISDSSGQSGGSTASPAL
jgi:integrase